MNARRRRTALAVVAAIAALLVLPGAPPAAAEEPDIPYFVETSGGALNQDGTGFPIVGHFTDQVLDDILWYRAGPTKESLWTPCPDCAEPFTKKQLPASLQVSGAYEAVVGDFAGDGLDDVYWVNRTSAPDYLWTNTGAGTFSSKRRDAPPEEANPLVLTDSRSGDGKDDILWTQSTGTRIRLWVFPDDGTGTARTRAWFRQPLGQPLVGDYDGNGAADVLWYPSITPCRCPVQSAASAIDTLWRRSGSETPAFTATTLNIKGEYAPIVGRFSGEGDGRDDILWIGQFDLCCGPWEDRPDSLWEGRSNGGFLASTVSFPSAGGGILLGHDVADTALVFGDGETNVWFDTTSGPVLRPVGSQLPDDTVPVIGRFVDASRDDVFAYYPGPADERLFHPVS
ncbi:MAG TPA: VCBS repeat-containing protein [Acidimicrobiales bacterium]|nr:VCBS repeat-containing protein [Acidimicrobiales bacterium]